MNDLISRQAAIDALKQQVETMSEWSNRYAEQRKGVLTAVNIVEDLPSAQPEIIRCKDCRWYETIYTWNCTEHQVCSRDPSMPPRSYNDFCSYAERIEKHE